jgi:hypothetical protein
MSLQGSPRMELDVRRRRWERRVAWLALIVVPVSPLLVLSGPMAVGCAASALCLVAAGLQRAGWIGRRYRIQRFVWTPDDRWQLTDAKGRVSAATLRVDSRIGSVFVWLRWNANRTRSMLLVSGDVAAADLRRLIVRLRLEGVRPVRDDASPDAKMQLP